MERNQYIGIILISVTLFLWLRTMQPSNEELEKAKMEQDSIALASQKSAVNDVFIDSAFQTNAQPQVSDSIASIQNSAKFGAFAPAAIPNMDTFVLENELIKITFASKGGFIKNAVLKEHYATLYDSNHVATKKLVSMLSSPENKFEYLLPLQGKQISTADLYFSGKIQGNTLTLTAPANVGSFEQVYTLEPNSYTIKYAVKTNQLQGTIDAASKKLPLFWENHLLKYERGEQYEQNYSTVYYKETGERRDYCSCTSDDNEDLGTKSLEWVSHTNQFFNASLMATKTPFEGGVQTTKKTDLKRSEYVKIVSSNLYLPIQNWDNGNFDMTLYVGPNEFTRLEAFNNDLEEVIPFGSSIFGTINRWVIRPFFDFLSGFISSKGVVILILIIIIKMALYPLMYKTLYSQAKMGALKPELAHLKEKYKDDVQKQQMETMKIYREYGVSPFGGCMPMLLQMPIWYALFRFFPASITFRQEPFLWATDLSSYDVLFYLPFEIPFFGAHVSLFTLLWALSTIVYAYYNMQNMDLSANPAMKYVQYLMPIMFLAFFNNYASGLTAYMFFSNLINIIQTVVTKNYIFDESKIRSELLKEKEKPKKKSVFQSKLEEAMKQQQAIQDQRSKSKK